MKDDLREPPYDDPAAPGKKPEPLIEPECLPPWEGEGMPPELAGVERAMLVLATRKARDHVVNETHDKEFASELVQNTFLKVCKTRRWNPEKGPFDRHFMLCVKSEMNHHFESKAPEKEAEAEEGFQREDLPSATLSIEDVIVARQTEAEQTKAREEAAARELSLLRERTAHHELVPRIIECAERGIEGRAAIAAELQVPVEKIYRALNLMRHHRQKIREADRRKEKK